VLKQPLQSRVGGILRRKPATFAIGKDRDRAAFVPFIRVRTELRLLEHFAAQRLPVGHADNV
jgi:hypothetical protein